MLIDEVRPGMRGYGLTVFRGTQPERFDVEVIDVLHGFRPRMDLILVRTEHPILAHAGTVAGMSGSPIYLDGRLAGAYAYGWAFGKDPVAGVTPIASMLEEGARPRRSAGAGASVQARRRSHGSQLREGSHLRALDDGLVDPIGSLQASLTDEIAVNFGGMQLQPAITPVMLTGFSDQATSFLAESFAPLGWVPLQTGGAQRPAGTAPEPYRPGGSIAVQLMRGDISATAVGTITHVDARSVYAFGHPMMNSGQTALPAATSRVLHILASESRSFKIAEALLPQGTLVQDRQAAIVVDSAQVPDVVPVRVSVHGGAGVLSQTWAMEVAQHPILTPLLVFAAVQNSLATTAGDQEDVMVEATMEVSVAGRPSLAWSDHFHSPRGAADGAALRSLRLFQILDAVTQNGFEEAKIAAVSVDLNLAFSRDVWEIVGASVGQEEVDPGQRIDIRVRLRRFGVADEIRRIPYRVPDSAAGETLELAVEAGASVTPEHPIAASLSDVLAAVLDRPAATDLVLSAKRPTRGLRFHRHVARSLPASALHALQPSQGAGDGIPFPTIDRHRQPFGAVLEGTATVLLKVRERRRSG